MSDIIPSLTEDEAAVLMIMKEGQPLVDLGEHSKWHGSLLSLASRGLCSAVSQFKSGSEYAITEAGRTAAEEWENQSIRDVIQANNKMAARKPLGPHVVNGKLFFQMPDGSSVNCICIGEPFASQIVSMWNQR